MDLEYLKEFVVLERIRNYTLAAEELYMTETTLSRHIKALEKELTKPLFLRTTRRIELTEFGQKFLMYAMKIVQTMEDCETELLRKPAIPENILMIGIFGETTHYATIQRALRRISEEHPEYIVGTVQGDIDGQKDKIINQKYHLAIVREPSSSFDDQFERFTILKEPLCVVCSKDDPLARKEMVDIKELNGRGVTLLSEHMIAHRLFLEECRNNGVEPNVNFLLREKEFVQHFVSIGSGISVLCRNMAERSVNPVTQVIREISPTIYEYVNLLYLRTPRLQDVTRNAITCFQEAVLEESADER